MKVRRSECGVMPSGSGLRPRPLRFSLARSTDLDDDPAAGVVAVLPATVLGREHEVVGSGRSGSGPCGSTAPRAAPAGDRPGGHRRRSWSRRPAAARPEDRRRASAAPSASPIRRPASVSVARKARRGVARTIHPRLRVELAAGVQQRDDLLGAVEPGPLRPDAPSAAAASRAPGCGRSARARQRPRGSAPAA